MSAKKDKSSGRPAGEAEPDTGGGVVPFDVELAELEAIVRRLEEGQLDLDHSLREYEQGVAALRRCHQRLAEAERRVEIVSGKGVDGQPGVVPFEEAELSLTEKAAQRDQRRTHASGGKIPLMGSADIDGSDRLF